MAWSLLDSDTTSFADGNAGHAYTFPHAVSAGNLLILGVNSDTVVSTPSGYTVAVSDVGNQGAYVFYKVAAGGETAVTVTTSGDHATALSFLRYSGSTATPLDQVTAVRVINNDTPQASPTVSPSALAGTGELAVLYGMGHHSQSATAISGVTASTGYTVLLTTPVSGGLNTTPASCHFVIAKTTATGSESPSVSWSGALFQDRTALFVSFILAATEIDVDPSSIASAEAFGTPVVTLGVAPPWTLITDVVTDYHASPNPFRPFRPSNRLRYRIGIGATMLRIGGIWRTIITPSLEIIATADKVYYGGRIYAITAAEAMQLIEQGFGDHVSQGD